MRTSLIVLIIIGVGLAIGSLAKHYTDYSPARLREIYDKVEPHLTL